MIDYRGFDRWLEAKGRSTNTRYNYAAALGHVGDISPAAVRAYFTLHAKKSPSTLQVARAAVRAYAAWQGVDDPTKGLLIRRPRMGLPRPMPMADVERMMSKVTSIKDRAMLQLLLHGLRRHEVVNLKLTDISILLDGPSEDDATLVLRFTGKGGHEAEVVLNRTTGKLLAEYLVRTHGNPDSERWFEMLEPLCRGFDNDSVFNVTDRGLNRLFAKYRDAAGLPPKWGPHSLRHTCGTELVERQVDIRVVQEVLRHKDIRMTMRYTQVSRGAKARAVERIPIPL